MKKVILICVLGVLWTIKLAAQNVETVYIRVQEPAKTTSSGFDAVMYVIKPDNTIETTPLKRLDPAGTFYAENGAIVKTEVNKWLNKGFKIISMNTSGGDFIGKTEVFMKKD